MAPIRRMAFGCCPPRCGERRRVRASWRRRPTDRQGHDGCERRVRDPCSGVLGLLGVQRERLRDAAESALSCRREHDASKRCLDQGRPPCAATSRGLRRRREHEASREARADRVHRTCEQAGPYAPGRHRPCRGRTADGSMGRRDEIRWRLRVRAPRLDGVRAEPRARPRGREARLSARRRNTLGPRGVARARAPERAARHRHEADWLDPRARSRHARADRGHQPAMHFDEPRASVAVRPLFRPAGATACGT